MLDPITGADTGKTIARTGHDARHPWPADAQLQGGRGIVLSREPGKTYGTAFVEAFVAGTFLRGEAATIADAEDDCWRQYQRHLNCTGHDGRHEYSPYPRGKTGKNARYRNGAGFCKHCGTFKSDVFTAAELGQFCEVCAEPAMWWWGETAEGRAVYLCEKHVDRKGQYQHRPGIIEEILGKLTEGDNSAGH